nr:MAG TPA: hypothetical protein [Caudoviricetes sp.]
MRGGDGMRSIEAPLLDPVAKTQSPQRQRVPVYMNPPRNPHKCSTKYPRMCFTLLQISLLTPT